VKCLPLGATEESGVALGLVFLSSRQLWLASSSEPDIVEADGLWTICVTSDRVTCTAFVL